MIEQLRSKRSGDTVAEVINGLKEHWLSDNGIGLTTVVGMGRYDYQLEGSQLIQFVRLALKELVRHGARPHHIGLPQSWYTHLYYGENETAIVEGVINDWVKMGMPALEWGDFWFAWPGTIEAIPAKDWYRAP